MAKFERNNGLASILFEKSAHIFTAVSFVSAASFFVAVLWLPSEAASSSPAIPLQTSLLLTLDKPQPPAPKMNLGSSSLPDEAKEQTLASAELASELNSWTFTQAQNPLLSAYLNLYQSYYSFELSVYNRFLSYELALFRLQVSFLEGLYNTYSNFLTQAYSRFH